MQSIFCETKSVTDSGNPGPGGGVPLLPLPMELLTMLYNVRPLLIAKYEDVSRRNCIGVLKIKGNNIFKASVK